MKKNTARFTPKARLIQILGEQLIKDASIGLVELVKNSYDADATLVQIIMYGLNTEHGKIAIQDNGFGMDTNIFLNKWMNPASGHKERQKKDKIRTLLGRLPLGEKGVGRFAAQQIGNKLFLVSKVKDSDLELAVYIDWRKFDEEEKNLSEVEIDYEERKAETFKHEESGTLLQISELRSEWTDKNIKKIHSVLKRMKSPFKGATDFDVTLKFENCIELFSKYEDLEFTDILEKAHYKLFGIVDKNGIFEFEYDFFVPGYRKNHKKATLDLTKSVGDIPSNLICGGFLVHFHNYEKFSDWLRISGIDKKDINDLSGVSIYRDGIRVLPYGEAGDDWLELDKRRIQQPSSKIGNDNIIGMIEINQYENNLLKDKTNREGLIENTAFYQFRKLVLAAIETLEKERKEDKPKKEKGQKEDSPITNPPKPVEDVKSTFSKVSETIEQKAGENLFADPEVIKEVKEEIEKAKEQVIQSVEDQQRENEILRDLAGTGLAAERFTHEFARMIRGALDSLQRLKKLTDLSNPKIKKEIDTIYGTLEALRNDIRLLGPMFYVKKVAKEKDLDIKQIIENTLSLHEQRIKKESVQIETSGNSFTVTMREGSCMQVFSNLIDNSIFWLSRKSELDRRKIRIILDKKNKTVFVSDSGSGVVERYKKHIFEPFFSMKGEDGRGLGLYIVKEILNEKNWDISLVSKEDYPNLLDGASFKIIFEEKSND